MDWFNGSLRALKSRAFRVARTWQGKVGLGVIAVALLVIVAFLNPISQSGAPKPQVKKTIYDQEISIPKIPGGKSSMRPLREEAVDLNGQLGLVSRWTAIENGDNPGQLLIDLTSIHLWRKFERTGLFQYIPKAHTLDANRNRPIVYELVNDAFECAKGVAEKLSLTVYYEDGAQQTYYPWRYPGASEWIPVRPDTTLSREMKSVCAVQLASGSQMPTRLDEGRLLGAWRVEDGAQGKIAAGPVVISEAQIMWTTPDSRKCTSAYQLASRSIGSAFPGGPTANDERADAYITFVLELKGPHLDPCAQEMNSLTVSFASDQRDFAHFTAFFLAPQGFGTMRRVSSARAIPPS